MESFSFKFKCGAGCCKYSPFIYDTMLYFTTAMLLGMGVITSRIVS